MKPEDAPKPATALLDLVPRGPIRSKPFDWRGNPARWRLLSGHETAACRTAAQRRAMQILEEDLGLERKDAFQLIQAGSSADTEREWFEHYIMGAALTDNEGAPVAEGSPDEVAQMLFDTIHPIERGRMIDEYCEFADEHDPSSLSEEDIEELIAEVGKRGGGSILPQYGSNSLRSFCATLVPRLIKAEAALAELQAPIDLEGRIELVEHAISQINKSLDGTS